MKTINSLSSRILSYFVKNTVVGACDPRTGYCCFSTPQRRRRSCAGHCYYSTFCA